jgi:tetratricopeptide (TPR) repeat protein
MKPDTLSALAVSVLVWLVAFPTVAEDSDKGKTTFAILSICRVEQHGEIPGGNPRIAIESGMGDGGFAIATTRPEAQAWFNYGIKLFHAFYHEDAKRAFDKAVAADPKCAMCLWGQALAHGPTANFDVSEDELKLSLGYAQQALAVAHTERDKMLAEAMIRRSSRKQDVAAERDFSADLLKAQAKTPEATDLRLIAAEALLAVFHRDDHSAASEAMALIEPVLAKQPQNTGAIHYYIHATEFAGHPALALAYAEKLSALAPKASHLVHMAAHTFLRVGRYEDAAVINAFALRVDSDHLADTATPGLPSVASYYSHNLAFGMAGAVMSGDRALALKFADHVHRAYRESEFANDELSYQEARRYVIYGRYDPHRMLALPEPSAEGKETLSFYHYAKGEGFAALHDAAGVAREAAQVTGDAPIMVVARGVLAGRQAMLQGHYADAAAAFEAAAGKQDAQLTSSFDPPPWWYPVRRSAAAAWLLDGQYAKAEAAARLSLKSWPADPLTLLILSRAEDGLGRAADARHDEAQAIGDWEGDLGKVDVMGI